MEGKLNRFRGQDGGVTRIDRARASKIGGR